MSETEDFFFVRPATDQKIPVGKRELPNGVEKIFPGDPKTGIVISTFGAPAYVDLALTVRKKLYPQVPVLVHDDCSDQTDALKKVCEKHDVLLESNSSRLGHEMGDLSAMIGGLTWAKETGVELLVKMSRRFVPVANWLPGLQKMAATMQYGTYGQGCQSYGLGLRTECFAMAVQPWSDPKVIGPMTEFMLKNRKSILIERYVQNHAAVVYEMNCLEAREFERRHVRITPRPVIAGWDFLGTGRKVVTTSHLWHETAPPATYAEVARQLGLDYPAEEFAGFYSQAGM